MEGNKDNVYNDYVKSGQETDKKDVVNLFDDNYDPYIQYSQFEELNNQENSEDNIYDSLFQSDEEEKRGKCRK